MKMPLFVLLPGLLLCQQQPTAPENASLEGQVVNSISGEPVRKARLTLRMNVAAPQGTGQQHSAPEAVPITVTSDATGKFEFANIEPGNYQLLGRCDGFANVQLGIKDGSKTYEPIVLGRGDRKIEFKVKMIPYGVISGRITEDDGDPIRNMPVGAMAYRYTSKGRELVESKSASTNDLGEYRLFDVPPGKYFIKASPGQMRVGSGPEDTEFYAAVYYPGAADSAGATAIELNAGQQVTGYSFTMRKVRYATIRGRVIAPPAATDVSVGRMVVSERGTSSTSSSVNDKTGKFQMFGIAPGLLYLTGSYTSEGQRYSTQLPVQVRSGDINDIELRPAPPAEVTGQVRIEGKTDHKPSQLQIMLQGPGRSYGAESSVIRDDGKFLFRAVDLNVYRVTANRMGTLYLKSIRWGISDITDSELDLTAGVPPRTELSLVFGADSAEIEGTVKNDKSEPVESGTVTLVPTGSHRTQPFHKSATTDAAGHFKIQGVAPGSYKAFAWDKVDANAVIFDPDFLRPHEGAGQNVEISSSEKKSFDLKLIVNDQKQ